MPLGPVWMQKICILYPLDVQAAKPQVTSIILSDRTYQIFRILHRNSGSKVRSFYFACYFIIVIRRSSEYPLHIFQLQRIITSSLILHNYTSLCLKAKVRSHFWNFFVYDTLKTCSVLMPSSWFRRLEYILDF